MATLASGSGTAADPWVLKTPPGTSEYQMYRDDTADPPELEHNPRNNRVRAS